MIKYCCDCCGKEMETWYVFNVQAQSERNRLGLSTSEALTHNANCIFAAERIYCNECKNRALAVLHPQQEDA